MASAYRVKYRGPRGAPLNDAVVTFATPDNLREDITDVAQKIKDTLVKARGGAWKPEDVYISEIEYVGVWFPYVDGYLSKT